MRWVIAGVDPAKVDQRVGDVDPRAARGRPDGDDVVEGLVRGLVVVQGPLRVARARPTCATSNGCWFGVVLQRGHILPEIACALVDHHQADVTAAAGQAQLELAHRVGDPVLRRVERAEAAVRLAVVGRDRDDRFPDLFRLGEVRDPEVQVAQQPARRPVLRVVGDVRGEARDRALGVAGRDLGARGVEHGRVGLVHGTGHDHGRLRRERGPGRDRELGGDDDGGDEAQQTHGKTLLSWDDS